MLFFKAASTATSFQLPSTFAGDRGMDFVFLIQEAIADSLWKKFSQPKLELLELLECDWLRALSFLFVKIKIAQI
jgi:hypothetical protein